MSAVTIMDVAEAAGVSFSTVSLALRHPLRVRETTRAKIEAAIERLGYERNPTASALASRSSNTSSSARTSAIAYVSGMPSMERRNYTRTSDPFLRQVESECLRLGYGFESINLEAVPNLHTLGRSLRNRGCTGVVFGPVSDTRLVDAVDWHRFSLVRCNNSLAHLDVPRVESDVFEAAWRTTQSVIQRGYRRIGLTLFRHARGFDDDVRRLGAFKLALEETPGNHKRSGPIFSHDGAWNRSAFLRWFKRQRLDALVCFGVVEYLWLLDEGIRIPEDIALAALTCAGEANAVTGCHEDFARITMIAFRMCEQAIRAREQGTSNASHCLMVPCLWHEGTTLETH